MKLFTMTITTMAIFVFVTIAAATVPTGYQVLGSGDVRYLGFIKVYDATLYAPEAGVNERILAEENSRCLQLLYDVDVSVADFIEAAETVLEEQQTPQILSRMRPYIDKLHSNYRDVVAGDIYTLCYDALTKTTSLSLNNEVLVEIESSEFAALYFGIWLSENEPLDRGLRNALLSGNSS